MSARANASAKQRRAGGASLGDKNNSFSSNSSESSCPVPTPKQSINVKQAIVILNTKINTLSEKLSSSSFSNNNNDLLSKIGPLDMRVSELNKKIDSTPNFDELKQEISKCSSEISEVKNMLLKLQTNVSDLQNKVIKN